jgi:hypothetical protein
MAPERQAACLPGPPAACLPADASAPALPAWPAPCLPQAASSSTATQQQQQGGSMSAALSQVLSSPGTWLLAFTYFFIYVVGFRWIGPTRLEW